MGPPVFTVRTLAVILVASLGALCCSPGPGPGEDPASYAERAERRAFHGAPPVIPHLGFSAECVSCHGDRAIEVPNVGLSPALPHGGTLGMAAARCRQCHVEVATDDVFVASTFVGKALEVSATGPGGVHGDRASEIAPPRLPHRVFMRENCLACHDGDAARPELRTSHPERVNCRQCHVAVASVSDPLGHTASGG